MKTSHTWLGAMPDPRPRTWFTKAEAVKSGAVTPTKVQFPFCWAWVDLYDGILLANGQRCPTHTPWIRDIGQTIGMRDREAVAWPPAHAQAWRESFAL